MHDLIAKLDVLDNEPGARRQQQLRIHRPGWPSGPPGRKGLPEASGLLQLGLPNLDIAIPRDSTAFTRTLVKQLPQLIARKSIQNQKSPRPLT